MLCYITVFLNPNKVENHWLIPVKMLDIISKLPHMPQAKATLIQFLTLPLLGKLSIVESFFSFIPRCLNFMFWCFRTFCSIFIGCVNKKNNWDEIAKVFIQVKVNISKYPNNLVPVILVVHTSYEDGTDWVFQNVGT